MRGKVCAAATAVAAAISLLGTGVASADTSAPSADGQTRAYLYSNGDIYLCNSNRGGTSYNVTAQTRTSILGSWQTWTWEEYAAPGSCTFAGVQPTGRYVQVRGGKRNRSTGIYYSWGSWYSTTLTG